MIEAGGPPGSRAVADVAGLRDSSGRMIGICGLLIVRHMAARAMCGCGGEVVAHVALQALRGDVRSGQREGALRVVERRWLPSRGRVAQCAVLREA